MINILLILCVTSLNYIQQKEMYGYRAPLSNKVASACYQDNHVRTWIYFTDKGFGQDDYARVLETVSNNMERSAYEKRLRKGSILDYGDIPLNRDYIREVEALGGLLIRESKWLNAASFWIFKQDIDRIAGLDFVHKITTVASYQGVKHTETTLLDSLVFGITYKQLDMFNIDELHNQGFFGSGVILGILDTGLRRKHAALDNIVVLAEHDFLEGDRIYMDDILISQESGVFSQMLFHKNGSMLYLFLSGDIMNLNVNVRDVLYTYSPDNGFTWSPLIKLTNNFMYQWVNDLNVCGRDTIFLFYCHRYGSQAPYYDIKYMVISDSTVLVQPTTLIADIYREPSAVQINDSIHVVFHTQKQLYLKKGDINGFLPSVIIDSSTQNIHAPEVIVGVNKIGVFYHTMPDDSLFFINDTVPETPSFAKSFIGIGKNAEAITYGDTIFLLWEDRLSSPLTRVAFSISNNFGATFSTPIYLSDMLNSLGEISLQKNGEIVKALWETQGNIYSNTSSNNGNSFADLDSLAAEFVYLPTLGTNNSKIIEFHCTRGDSITDGYLPDDPEYPHLRHGTEMLSAIGGYLRDTYIGVAPATQFLVAKTENPDDSYEFPVEEDTWIAGLEWFESKGADIVNSSLGYTEGYSWPNDYDGNTSPASIAANEAAKRGLIIVNSSGNFSVPRIVIPGDAQGVLTVGGIDSVFNRWEFSGYDTTADHSLKPEIVCLAHSVIVVHPDSTNSYLASRGTSGAAAMVSGICALLLEGHPNWNVDSVKSALFQTASHASAPTDSMGYGWPDALAAFYASPTPFDTLGGSNFLTPYPNPFILTEHSNIYIPFQLEVSNNVELRIYSISGRLIRSENRGLILPGRYTDTNPQAADAAFIWDGNNEQGEEVPSGMYYCLLVTRGGGSDVAKIAVIR